MSIDKSETLSGLKKIGLGLCLAIGIHMNAFAEKTDKIVCESSSYTENGKTTAIKGCYFNGKRLFDGEEFVSYGTRYRYDGGTNTIVKIGLVENNPTSYNDKNGNFCMHNPGNGKTMCLENGKPVFK